MHQLHNVCVLNSPERQNIFIFRDFKLVTMYSCGRGTNLRSDGGQQGDRGAARDQEQEGGEGPQGEGEGQDKGEEGGGGRGDHQSL